MTVYAALKAIHVLCAVIWVGAMFFAIVVLRPSLQVLEPAQRLALHAQIYRRLFLVVWHVMPLIILTGFAIILGVYGGMAGTRWPVHLMTLLGLVMGAVFVVIWTVPYRRFRTATEAPVRAAAVDLIRRLITLNLVLGLLTIVIAHL